MFQYVSMLFDWFQVYENILKYLKPQSQNNLSLTHRPL